MDVSDGLMLDLIKLCTASRTGARVRARDIPIHIAAMRSYPDRALAWAAGGGEDYQLLFTAPPETMRRAQVALTADGVRTTPIGELTDDPGSVGLFDAGGNPVTLERLGWEHFSA
jgi:thiamine-monophosphate kinase